MGPRHVTGLSDIACVPSGEAEGRDSIDEKDYTAEGEEARAATELFVEHLHSQVSEFSSLIQGHFSLGLGS